MTAKLTLICLFFIFALVFIQEMREQWKKSKENPTRKDWKDYFREY